MKKQALSNTELTIFFDQLSMILRAGISALEGVAILREDASSASGKELLSAIYAHLEETGCLYESLDQTGVFPDYAVHMTELGETSGCLDEVAASLSEYYEREEAIASSIRSAVAYPLVMLGMILVVIFLLMAKVMPVFSRVYEQLGVGMTGISAAVLNLGTAMNTYAAVFLAVFAAIAVFFLWIARSPYARRRLAAFARNAHITRALSEKIACSRLTGAMSLALKSGLDTDEALSLAAQILGHPATQKKVEQARTAIAEGAEFAAALTDAGIFSGLYGQMVTIGSRTGSLDQVMARLSSQYETETDDTLRRMIGVIEPTMVAVLSVIVGLILLAVMLPLIGVLSGIS